MEKKLHWHRAGSLRIYPGIFNENSPGNGKIFLALLVINILLSWIFQEYIMTRDAYHTLLSDKLESYRIDQQLDIMNRFKIWGYLLLPLVLWFKFTCVTLLLQLPLLLKFIEIPFRKIFRVVMIASLAIVMMNAVFMLQLYNIPAAEITNSLLKVQPLSLSSLLDISAYPESALAVLSTFNLFEAGWLFLIFYGFTIIAGKKLKKSDIALLISGVWSFLLFLNYALLIYMEKAFG
jgi:hypothetical protein